MTKYHILRKFKYLKNGEWIRGFHDSFEYIDECGLRGKKMAELKSEKRFKKSYPISVAVRAIVEELS